MTKQTGTILAVVFDLDDTLFAERDYIRSGYRAVAAHLRETLQRDEAFEAWLWDRFLAGRSAGAFDALNDHFHLNLSADRIAELVRLYREHRPQIAPRAGLPAFLGRLHEHYKLALMGDGFLPAQPLKLAALKLERFFDAVVFTEQLGRDAWKPAPDGFEAVREKLSIPHAQCAYVSDNPAKDFIAPNRLGWLTIQYLFPEQIHAAGEAPAGGEPRQVVRSLERLVAALLRR